jgi:hypothetical protein
MRISVTLNGSSGSDRSRWKLGFGKIEAQGISALSG